MDKIPCIKCTLELWEYIRPYLEEWGYTPGAFRINFERHPLLVINAFGNKGKYNSDGMSVCTDYNRELVTNVEEFLEKAAILRNFTYKRKDIIKINEIEIKPGMGICIDNKYSNNKFYVIIPTKSGLAVINYGQSCHWLHLDSFLSQYKDRIVAICDLATQSSIRGDFLWEAPKEIIITMDEKPRNLDMI